MTSSWLIGLILSHECALPAVYHEGFVRYLIWRVENGNGMKLVFCSKAANIMISIGRPARLVSSGDTWSPLLVKQYFMHTLFSCIVFVYIWRKIVLKISITISHSSPLSLLFLTITSHSKACSANNNENILQYIPRNMHTVLLCFALLWLCNRS